MILLMPSEFAFIGTTKSDSGHKLIVLLRKVKTVTTSAPIIRGFLDMIVLDCIDFAYLKTPKNSNDQLS